jgi:hypothetical protein
MRLSAISVMLPDWLRAVSGGRASRFGDVDTESRQEVAAHRGACRLPSCYQTPKLSLLFSSVIAFLLCAPAPQAELSLPPGLAPSV